MRINFDLYRPSETERWISDVYQQNGIYHPRDLSIAAVAEIFNVIIKLYDGPVFAEWEEGSYSFIFLNRNKSLVEQKNEFFHELCHPLRHVGRQNELPRLFQELQEMQASKFQLIAAMPVYLIQQVPCQRYWEQYINNLAYQFEQPAKFVERRIQQIADKINYNHYWAQVSKIV
ncbi:MAG TPA: ImmA/IrrE family metallo-endopeptidase [Sphingobacteriaceae bacterium]|nr:ImmA/IrrE family metallo-endopeptidase [Sphingobacteriaceae bacterium]